MDPLLQNANFASSTRGSSRLCYNIALSRSPIWARNRRNNVARSLRIQGVVYGFSTPECELRLSNDRIPETVVQYRSLSLAPQSGHAIDVAILRVPREFIVFVYGFSTPECELRLSNVRLLETMLQYRSLSLPNLGTQ